MSRVRVLVGTRKGAFVLTADGTRAHWDVSGAHFGGWEIYHLKGSPADPNRLYASQTSSWFGQVIQRSSDGGKTWGTVGNKFAYEAAVGNHLWYDGTQRPFEFARVWHLEPSLDDPDTVYAGIQDAAMFRTIDGGQTWRDLRGRRLPERRCRRDVAADESRARVRADPESHSRGRPLRASDRDASVAPERPVHAEALGRDAQ